MNYEIENTGLFVRIKSFFMRNEGLDNSRFQTRESIREGIIESMKRLSSERKKEFQNEGTIFKGLRVNEVSEDMLRGIRRKRKLRKRILEEIKILIHNNMIKHVGSGKIILIILPEDYLKYKKSNLN